MRKYSIPKFMYVLVVLILAGLSIGYTYAYFSAMDSASSSLKAGEVDVCWVDSESGMTMQSLTGTVNPGHLTTVNNVQTIKLTNSLKRDGYVHLQTKDKSDQNIDITLQVDNRGTVDAYCRIKITATYVPLSGGNALTCEDGWLKLYLNNADTFNADMAITDLGWTYYNGYYYYGSVSGTDLSLTPVTKGNGEMLANYIYLDKDAPSKILGATVNIVVTLEAVQTTNDAYKSVWNLT